MAAMTIAAIGIVYGDIGTSPLYTMKAVFIEEHGLAADKRPCLLLGFGRWALRCVSFSHLA